ncbi:hypothetical protein [Bdellovibrio sp.]|uniref:hypothetical protein n=1 Tax=Bdellovibrio sp. TaxID=28201 RepID=UPI0039E4392F
MKTLIFLISLFSVTSFAGEATSGGGVRPKQNANFSSPVVEYIKIINFQQNGGIQIKYQNSINRQIETHVVNSVDLDPAVLDAVLRSAETSNWEIILNQN